MYHIWSWNSAFFNEILYKTVSVTVIASGRAHWSIRPHLKIESPDETILGSGNGC